MRCWLDPVWNLKEDLYGTDRKWSKWDLNRFGHCLSLEQRAVPAKPRKCRSQIAKRKMQMVTVMWQCCAVACDYKIMRIMCNVWPHWLATSGHKNGATFPMLQLSSGHIRAMPSMRNAPPRGSTLKRKRRFFKAANVAKPLACNKQKSRAYKKAVKGLKCPEVLQPSRVYKQSTAATTYCANSFRTSQKLAKVQRSCDIVIYIPNLHSKAGTAATSHAASGCWALALLALMAWYAYRFSLSYQLFPHVSTRQICSSNLCGVRDGQWSLGEAFRVHKCQNLSKKVYCKCQGTTFPA